MSALASFNPRSRVGSDLSQEERKCRVSRFNPRSRVGSDSRAGVMLGWLQTVSIHAPAWGATAGLWHSRCPRFWFQSTLPRGERRPAPAHLVAPPEVSIHAPAWGATSGSGPAPRDPGCFNPRSRVGSDPGRSRCESAMPGFNPRSRVGSDSAPSNSSWRTTSEAGFANRAGSRGASLGGEMLE